MTAFPPFSGRTVGLTIDTLPRSQATTSRPNTSPSRLDVALGPSLPHHPAHELERPTLPVLLNGLPSKSAAVSQTTNINNTDYANLAQPGDEQIAPISPLAQVQRNTYRTPTYLIHGTRDDLIPWQQSQEFRDALQAKGVQAELGVVEGGVHLFYLYRAPDGRGWESVRKGYEFCFEQSK